MSPERHPPPDPEDCLIHARTSSYKGGTLIAEDVTDLATHLARVCDPDGYRPARCPRCGGDVLHVHDYPERKPCGQPGAAAVRVVRHICANPDCEATWRILPAFLARHLWWTWPSVERTTSQQGGEDPRAGPVPQRTARRWRSRLGSAAKQLIVLLAASGGVLLEALAKAVGLDAPRRTLVDAYATLVDAAKGHRLAGLSALVHRLERGIRLM